VNVVHDELSAVPAGASVAVFGCGRQQARLYVLVPDPGLDETAREELLGVIQAWAGRYSGVGHARSPGRPRVLRDRDAALAGVRVAGYRVNVARALAGDD
jgi:hypothetical protein